MPIPRPTNIRIIRANVKLSEKKGPAPAPATRAEHMIAVVLYLIFFPKIAPMKMELGIMHREVIVDSSITVL